MLGVESGPVVTEAAALQMARGVARLFGADVALSVTGVGGPDPEEGKPPGTVCEAAREEALRLLEEHLGADNT